MVLLCTHSVILHLESRYIRLRASIWGKKKKSYFTVSFLNIFHFSLSRMLSYLSYKIPVLEYCTTASRKENSRTYAEACFKWKLKTRRMVIKTGSFWRLDHAI